MNLPLYSVRSAFLLRLALWCILWCLFRLFSFALIIVVQPPHAKWILILLRTRGQFDFQYNKQLQKQGLYRTDAGGKMSLGQWDIQTSGQKLAMALGLSHNTAQELMAVGLAVNSTSVESSVHYRRHNAAGLFEHYDFPILTPADGTLYGHSVMSRNCVNMFARDLAGRCLCIYRIR